jgi:hypothetical protein
MSVPVLPVTVNPGQSTQVPLQNGNLIKAVKVSNKAPYDLVVDGLENTGARWQAAGLEEWYFPEGTCNGTCDLTAYNNANLSNPAAGIVLITPYYMNDTLPKNAGQSTTIPTQVVQANVSTISVLQNLRQTAGTQWLQVTDTNGNVVWSADNNGNLFVGQEIAGAVTTLLQLIAGGTNPIELLGNLVNWSTTGDYNGQNLNLGKRKILSIQNGAGTAGNVFGVDANDNTFFQHNSNNQTVLYDKNGNLLITIDATGNTIYNNAQTLKWKDSGGTVRNVLNVDNANNAILRGITGNDQILLQNGAGTLQVIVDLVKGALNIPTTAVNLPGTTAGSAQLYMPFTGANFKLAILIFNGYQNNTATEQTIALPVAFSTRCNWLAGNGKPTRPYSGGTALTNKVNVNNNGIATTGNTVNSNNMGEIIQGFDALGLGTNEASQAFAIYFFVGI